MAVELYIGIHPKYVMVLLSEIIWTMECSTGPVQIFYVYKAQKDHYQSGYMPR